MKRSYLLLCALVFALLSIGVNVSAQTTNEGTPHSWNLKTVVADAPVATMPTFDLQQALFEDSINNAQKSAPWRFGFNHMVDLGTNNSGQWINLPNGDRIWRIELFSKHAVSMNIIFDDITIPTGGSIYLYSPDQQQLIGAYTEINNNAEHMLGTEILNGSRMVVEYYEPAAVGGQGTVHIGTVTHGYKHVKTYVNGMMKALNSSGDCNIDILCPLGVGWEDQSAAVAMIVVGGNGICTGTLVNNTANDGTPYFLTANHCGTTGGATWSFRFHWNSPNPSCATTTPSTNGPTNFQTANGATLRANNSGSDMALWEIDNLPLATAQAWNLYFAGWDRSTSPATQVTGIHHPSGDVKKICREDQTVVADVWNFNGDPNTQVWRVNDWDQGVTEPGSSGSALFNSSGLIVGQLAGGSAACSGTNDNGGYDGYGRFDISWDGNNASERLRDWLDPSNTSQTNPGWDPNQPTVSDDAGINGITVPDGVICSTTFDPEVELRNFGTNALTSVQIIYDVDGAGAQTFNWSGNLASNTSTTVTLPTVTTTGGAHTFNATTNLPNGVTDNNLVNDAASNPFIIVANPETVDFTLNLDCWGSEVTWTVEQGGVVYYSGGPYTDATPGGAGQITEQWCLEGGQCYDFIINDTYGDGMYGSQYGSCTVDGDYSIDQGATQLATVIAANSDWGNQEINNFCVAASGGGLTADFTGTPLTVCEGSTVTFTDATTGGTPTGWAWTFPGGTPGTSTQQNPTVTYNTAGTYDVTLVASDGGSSDTETKVGYITVVAAPVVTATSTDVSCFGSCDGSATATAIGNGPFTYLWSGGQTTASVTNLCAGTYTVDVTDATGCTGSTSVTIAEPTAITISISGADASCNGVCDGTATATVTGGTPPYTYSWSPTGGTGATATGLCAGAYTLVVTDANGCTGTGTYTVGEPPVLVLTGTATDESSCGAADGTITLAATGGTTPYQYSIDNGVTYQASPNFTGLSAGVYICVVQDANGCTATYTITLTTTGGLNVAATAVDESCPGSCDGLATVTVTNGTAPYTYAWTPNVGTTATVSNLCAGTYQVVVTDATGCTGTTSVTVGAGSGVTITGTSTDATCGNNDGTITLTATGGAAPYQYSIDGGVTYQASNTFTGLGAGTYVCYAQDANGCTSNAFTIVINNQGGPTVTSTSFDASCPGACDGGATVTASGGTAPYSYSWSPSGQSTAAVTNLCAGTYQVVVTDANGCTTTETVVVGEPTAIVITGTATDASCGNSDGSITLTATGGDGGPYQYSIDGGITYQSSNTFANLAAGTYVTFAQDGNGCTSNAFTLVINNNGGPTTSAIANDVTCGGFCNGSATVAVTGGTSPYTYLWSPGNQTTATVGNLCAGTYQVTITDANGCSTTETVVINEPTAVVLTGTWTDASCGAADGTIDLTATGGNPPYQYSIDNGATFQALPNFTNLADGIYVTQVMDANGCTAIYTIVIGNSGGTTLQTSATDVSCAGQCDGSATVTATGGTSPHTYLWTPGNMTTSTVTNLCAGTYTCVVTDANGCAVTEVVVISEPTFIVVTGTSTPEVNGNDGAVDITVSGGTAPYSYSWDNGATTEDQTGLAGGTYIVTVTDANGCTQVFTIVVDSFVGIEELGGVTLNLYPNPTNGIVNLAFGNLNGGELNVQVLDARGRAIATGKLVNANGEQIMTLDISDAAPGVYFLQVSNDSGSVTEKLLKH